jgi:ATP-dependent Clp protease ATP-binding subunit ClpC
MERFNVSRLIGAPPGYVGYEEGGQLTEKVRRNPYSIVLFDEIEKGHRDVFNLLLQILDEGKLTDSLGHIIDFKNTIIIMTSNIGTQSISSTNLGFTSENKSEAMNELMFKEVKKYFKPEFLNRIDDLIIFNSLTMSDLYKIIDLQLNDLRENMIKKNMKLKINQSAKKVLLSEGSHREWGARPIRRIIQSSIENVISYKFLNNEFHENTIIEVGSKLDGLVFKEVKIKSKATLKNKPKTKKVNTPI